LRWDAIQENLLEVSWTDKVSDNIAREKAQKTLHDGRLDNAEKAETAGTSRGRKTNE